MANKNAYYVVSGTPALNVRNAARRNQRRLSKRLARLGDAVTLTLPNGTLKAYRVEDVTRYTVKRDAERAAKRDGGELVTV